jgi:hydrogenase maturation protease
MGSPFGDDRIAWQLVDGLRGRLPDAVELVTLDRPGAALIQWMEGVDHLVLVDALLAPGKPGRVTVVDLADIGDKTSVVSSHQLALIETLALARALGCLPGRLTLVGITVAAAPMPASRREGAGRDLCRQLVALLSEAPQPGPGTKKAVA